MVPRFARLAQALIVACLWLALFASQAPAVVIQETSDAVFRAAPADDPGWSHMGIFGNGTAVYLGQGWVLTANHVTGITVRLTDGRDFSVSKMSQVVLTNPAGGSTFGNPDLKMFRVIGDPGLSNLTVSDNKPAVGTSVTMMGAGKNRHSALVGWSIDAEQNWTQVPLPLAEVQGYLLDTTTSGVMRWGTNNVQFADFVSEFNTHAFATTFNRPAASSEAQAVLGDSGGGMFIRQNGSWELAGIMIRQQHLDEQPENTVTFGSHTIAAQLADYREQILSIMERSPWQNQVNRFDANRSGTVTSLDMLVIINELQERGVRSLTGGPTENNFLFDVDGNRTIAPLDLLQIINFFSGPGAPPTAWEDGSVSPLAQIPEPSGWALGVAAAVACAGWLAARWALLFARQSRATS